MTQEARARLAEMESKGELTPERVVKEAKRPTSPLNGMFQWDLKKAAYRHWIEQARTIIRSLSVVVTEDTITARVPLYIRDPRTAEGYMSILSVGNSKDMARQAILSECKAVSAALQRAKSISVQLGMEPMFDRLIADTINAKAEIENLAA